MKFFKLFKPASQEAMENKADRLFNAGEFGLAKQAYEKALLKLENSDLLKADERLDHIKDKISRTRDALARQHKATAEDLMEADYHEDAVELLKLALDLTAHAGLSAEIKDLLTRCQNAKTAAVYEIDDEYMTAAPDNRQDDDEAYFTVLCSTLPEDLQMAYEQYGDAFMSGYIALNQGSFEIAAELLAKALAENRETVTHIHLELATACLNLGDIEKSRALLAPYIEKYPLSVRAYEMMCEICWEKKEYKQAERLISECPDDIKTSIPIMLLMGETLFKSGSYDDAEAFYQNSIHYTGWSEPVATALARIYEAMGLPEKALASYGEIMRSCKSCRQQIAPFVKQRYAELTFEAGDMSTGLIELYFALCSEDPGNRSHYYRRLSEIYSRQGYHEEANRYLKFAEADESEHA
jgi:tetratricopeptide (TPR) repeat protein